MRSVAFVGQVKSFHRLFQLVIDRIRLESYEPETVITVLFFIVFLFGYVYTGFVCLPDFSGGTAVFNHYIFPVILAIGVMTIMVGRKSWRTSLIILGFCVVSILFHFNFKTWTPLIHSRLYDIELNRFDSCIGVVWLKDWVGNNLGVQFLQVSSALYHLVFVGCFFCSFFLCTVYGGAIEARRLNFSICLVLLTGGVLYWVCPALGPFVFMHWVSNDQAVMLRINTYIHQTGFIPRGMFLEGLAAMPSLHLAHATVFLVHVWHNKRIASIPFVIVAAWFALAAMYLGWHYFLDLIPGVMLGSIVCWLSYRIKFSIGTVVSEAKGNVGFPRIPV